jgi:hypothetical protein
MLLGFEAQRTLKRHEHAPDEQNKQYGQLDLRPVDTKRLHPVVICDARVAVAHCGKVNAV